MYVLQPISYGLLGCVLLLPMRPKGMWLFGSRPRTGGSDRQGECENMTLLSGPGCTQMARGARQLRPAWRPGPGRAVHAPPPALLAITILALHARTSPCAQLTRAGQTPRSWRPP
jgi:hypothetical protein